MTNSLPTPRALFQEAQDLPTAAARKAFLDQACQNDPQLRGAVEALLASYESAGDFLESPAADLQPIWTENCGTDRGSETSADDAKSEEVSLDFLMPAHEAGHLGRLAHYEVLEFLGQGGMGVVLKAIDENLQRVVAIKVLAPQLATSATARKRFVREARAAAAVRNEHVVSIYAVEETQGLPYLVMECIGGVTLQQRLDAVGALEPAEVLRIGMQIAAGLAAAHAQGLIHRDIKPANILLENGVERVKITDFGLARVADDASLTQSGFLAGTPQYMSPEQAEGQPISEASDLFSLGSVLYAMCTGQPPFRASTTMGVLKRVCENKLRPIHEANPNVPQWLVKLIDKLHANEPKARFRSAAEVAAELGRHLAELQQPAVPPVSHDEKLERAAPRIPRLAQGKRWLVAAAVLLCLFASLGLTEATGVTEVVPTVIRIVTGEGTLVVQTDPDVNVTIEGGGDLTFNLPRGQAIHVPMGRYRVTATRNGQPIPPEKDVITITRGSKQIVRVRYEADGATAKAILKSEPAKADAAQSEALEAPGEVRRFIGHTGPVWSVAITRDGRHVVSTSRDSTARVWDAATGQELSRFEGHELCVYCAAITPDGQRVLSGSGGKSVGNGPPERKWSLCLWELETGKELKRLDGEGDEITSIAFSADGSKALVGCNSSGKVMLWDVDAWREIKRIATVPRVWSVDFSPDGSRFVTASGCYIPRASGQREEGRLQVWNLNDGQEIQRFAGHEGGMFKAVFSPSGNQIASTGGDRTIRFWNVQTGALERRITVPDVTTGITYSANGKTLLQGNYGLGKTVGLWNVETGQEIQSFAGHTNGVQSVAISRDGRWAVSGSHDSTVRLWQLPPVTMSGEPRTEK